MKREIILPNGKIDRPVWNALSEAERSQWVYDLLHRSAPEQLAADPEGILPHYLLSHVYHQGDPPVGFRAKLQGIVLRFLADLARGRRSWRNDSGDELLLLAEEILNDSPRRKEAIELLLRIARTGLRRRRGDLDFRLRAMGALLQFEHAQNQEFWLEQYNVGGPEYAYSVFDGLALIDPQAAFDWVAALDDEKLAADVIEECVPGLVHRLGPLTTLPFQKDKFNQLPDAIRGAFHKVAEYERIDLEVSDAPASSRLVAEA